jgi:plasmid stabilization system protein ParE
VRIRLLDEAQDDLKWWRRYYRVVFPQGRKNALRHFEKVVELLLENPYAGRKVEELDLYQFVISNTPFSIVYRLRGETLEIVRVWDMRKKPTHGFQEE